MVGAFVGALVGAARVMLAVEIVETLTDVPIAVEIADARVLMVQLPEHPLVYADGSDIVSIITKVTVAARLPVIDDCTEMPVPYDEHGEVHAPTAIP